LHDQITPPPYTGPIFAKEFPAMFERMKRRPDTKHFPYRRSRGASLLEYGIILGLVGAVSIPMVSSLGEEIVKLLNNTTKNIAIGSITVPTDPSTPLDPDAFVFEVSSATGAIFPSAGGTIQIDWGDEAANSSCTTSYVIDPNNPLTCDYPSPGTYKISITGDMTGYGQLSSSSYKNDITRQIQWGNTGLTSLANAFYGAENVTDVPGSIPPSVTSINRMFTYSSAINDPDIALWDTSNISNFDFAFADAENFNVDLSSWNTSNATTMKGVFRDAIQFNQDIDGWNMSNVTDIQSMFSGATNFNQDLSSWDTSNVELFTYAFRYTPFNGDVSSWNTASATSIRGMFQGNSSFNQDISAWNVSNVQDFERLFNNATSFNQDLSGWNVGNGTNFDGMFLRATQFESDLSGWNMSSSETLYAMFKEAAAFDSDLSTWDVANVTDMYQMFSQATSFSGDLSGWDVANVSNMSAMFLETPNFTSDLSGWCVSLLATRPPEFSTSSAMAAEPIWGTCP